MSEAEAKAAPSPWSKVFWMFVILIAAGLIAFLASIWLGNQAIDAGKENLNTAINLFKPNEVIRDFHEWRELQVDGNEGNVLELATAEATEKLTRSTNVEWFGKVMPLGTTISDISIPATYRYHIDLSGEWFIESDGGRLMVIAPKLQPSLPVAFDTGRMQKKTKSGWGRWDGNDNLAELEKSITTKLAERASDEKTIAKIRDEARLSLAKFLKTWLLKQEGWGEGRFEEIVVKFEDEEDLKLLDAPETLRLGSEIPDAVSEATGLD
ncbi:MAG: DUF4230 domain-containing protein [Verrucomicrobiales bacterium]|nr:DUF4230 domain-containing protein [Verrucomicrobiales bacterium]